MMASMLAGLAFSNASLGAVHAMAHSLGGLFDFPHGLCNALLLEHVVEYNFDALPHRYRAIAKRIGLVLPQSDEEAKLALSRHIRDFRLSLGLLGSELKEFAPNQLEISRLAACALQDPCIITNPKIPTQEDLEAIYAKIF